jgi:hypothetical protein
MGRKFLVYMKAYLIQWNFSSAKALAPWSRHFNFFSSTIFRDTMLGSAGKK